MIIKEISPNIRQFHYKQEKCDENYGSCLWATITLDCDNYTLLAESDCGNYAYGWHPTPNTESFIHLICRLDRGYLLEKLSCKYVLDLAQSKEDTIESVLESGYELSDNDIQAIRDIEDFASEESFYRECDEILRCSDADIRDRFELIQCVKRYPVSAVTFVDIFCDVLQPFLREDKKNECK